jgi:hypothetical protein
MHPDRSKLGVCGPLAFAATSTRLTNRRYSRDHSDKYLCSFGKFNALGTLNLMKDMPMRYTLDQYKSLSHRRDELLDGEILVSPTPTVWYARLRRRIQQGLQPLEEKGYEILPPMGCELPPQSLLAPAGSRSAPDAAPGSRR